MIKFGTLFSQRDILIVPFPFSNLQAVIQRPVLVLSNEDYNRSSGDVIVCGITSNLKKVPYSVVSGNDNLSEGRIPVQSKVKVDKLFTIEKEIVKKKISTLDEETFEKVKEEFCSLV